MQSSEVISLNIWQILISLCNLLLLFLILKKFLYKPVKKMLAERQQMIDEQYNSAQEAERSALQSKAEYEEKIKNAQSEADVIIKKARAKAERRSDKIIDEAKQKSDEMLRQAKNEVRMEKKRASSDIKREIAEVSTILTEKILEREINSADHREFIDSFIDGIGDEYDGN